MMEEEEDQEYMKYLEILVVKEEEEEKEKEKEELNKDHRGVEEDDPSYKFFLEHLREDGKSYVFEVKGGGGEFPPVYVKYEQQQQGKKMGTSLIDDDILPECSPSCPKDSEHCKDVLPLFLVEDTRKKRKMDASYMKFLKHVKIESDKLVMESDEGVIKYEQESECNVKCEQENQVPTDDGGGDTVKGGSSPCRDELKSKRQRASRKCYSSCADEDDRDSVQSLTCLNRPSEFEEKLREVLNKEYSEQELEEKYREAKNQKPLERQRVLRGRSLSYPTELTSPSYLDYHPDLAEMVRKAVSERNVVRALSLLRCLFFYLKNVSHDGAFIPWRNSSILKLIQALDNQL